MTMGMKNTPTVGLIRLLIVALKAPVRGEAGTIETMFAIAYATKVLKQNKEIFDRLAEM
jgi:hypothetical protein